MYSISEMHNTAEVSVAKFCVSASYYIMHIPKDKKINTKYSLYFFSYLKTTQGHRCSSKRYLHLHLFTAYFDVFTFTWSKRSTKNTVLRTKQNSKWVPDFRKRYSLMMQQFSVQYSIMQISFIHMMLNVHFF